MTKKYYVSGNYDGLDIGMEIEAKNEYMAAYSFIDEVSMKVKTIMLNIFISNVEELEGE